MAYTDLALAPHTDTTYFTEPAGLQMFHLLEHDGTGGESQLIDGFRAAEQLRTQSNLAFNNLSSMRSFYHASGNDGISIQPAEAHPVFELEMNLDSAQPQLKLIRWNSADRGAVVVGASNMSRVYRWYSSMAYAMSLSYGHAPLTLCAIQRVQFDH